MKETFLDAVIHRLESNFTAEQIAMVAGIVKDELSKYEINKRTNDEEVRMRENSQLVGVFLSAKRIEGCSEKTIHYYRSSIENLTATTLRNIIGELELDATLTSRDTINSKITEVLDEATDAWGIKINRVELKNIMPPREIQDSMEKQMKAERERREKILQAEGEKKAAILVAEGEKESAILRADAIKESKIREAEGEAAAILKIQEATAAGIDMINKVNPSKEFISIKALESFEKAADGQATKIIIPSEIQGLAGLATSLTELAKKD